MKLTPEQLREIAERAEQAETGPWEYLADDNVVVCNCKLVPVVAEGFSMTTDGIFIAASRTDIPLLLAHIKALEKESWAYQAALRGACAFIESAGFQTTADAYREVLGGADNSKEASHE